VAFVHDVTARLSGGGSVRSTVRIDDKPSSGTGVYRVGPIVDGQGVLTQAEQRPKHAPLFSLGGLAFIVWRLAGYSLRLGLVMARAAIMAFGWLSWNVIHLSLQIGHDLSGKTLELMDDYAIQRSPALAPWLDRHDLVKELPADVVDDTKQLPDDTAVNLLPKSKKKVSA
jgi:hypothetical protein